MPGVRLLLLLAAMLVQEAAGRPVSFFVCAWKATVAVINIIRERLNWSMAD